jgi:hypothetical protein
VSAAEGRGCRPAQPTECFWIPAEPYDERGWVPSLVSYGIPGHSPLTGRGEQAQPWFWGRTREQALEMAEQENAKLGVTPERAAEIVASSLRAQGGRA